MPIDWTIPVTSIVAAAVAVIGALWTVARRDATLKEHEKRFSGMESTLARLEQRIDALFERISAGPRA